MPAFEPLTCALCEDEFVAHSDGNAVATRYCSPADETAGQNLV